MKYEKTNHAFSSKTGIFSFSIMLLMLIFGGFGWLDNLVKSFTQNSLLQSLYFFGIIAFINFLIQIPISYYHTFVIEEKFGFNKMTKKLFFIDTIKSFLLSLII
jgi:STE24 endopeptidase